MDQNNITKENLESLEVAKKLANIRYNTYTFFILVVAILCYPLCTDIYSSFVTSQEKVADAKIAYQDKQSELSKYQKKDQFAKLVAAYSSDIGLGTGQQQEIDALRGKLNDPNKKTFFSNCIIDRQEETCKGYATGEQIAEFSGKREQVRSVYLVRERKPEKSDFGQQKVIEALSSDVFGDSFSKVKSISFGGVRPIKEKMYVVPISISASLTFQELQKVLDGFEKKMNFNTPVLLQVDAVAYDVAKDDQEQDVSFNSLVYFYEN